MTSDYQKGSIIGDRYEILQVLGGEGLSGIGVVYICRDLKRSRRAASYVALKTLQNKYIENEENLKCFKKKVCPNHHALSRLRLVSCWGFFVNNTICIQTIVWSTINHPSNQIYFKCDLNQLTAFGT